MITVRVLDQPDPVEPRQPRRRWVWLLVVTGLIAAALLMGFLIDTIRTASTTGGSPSAPASQTASSTPDPEVAPGLRRGLATVAAGNTGAKYGIPYGWPQNTEGAVSAAMNIAASFCTLPMMVDATRAELEPIMYTADGLAENAFPAEVAAKRRRGSRLNDDGVVVLPDGQPSPTEKYYGCGLPRYGAYKVISEDPSQVVVEVWMPYVAGPGTDDNLSEVFLGTIHAELTMRWNAGPVGPDWRLSHDKPLPVLDLPTSKSNVGWQGIRDIVGPGWMVPADATTKPYPGSVWAS